MLRGDLDSASVQATSLYPIGNSALTQFSTPVERRLFERLSAVSHRVQQIWCVTCTTLVKEFLGNDYDHARFCLSSASMFKTGYEYFEVTRQLEDHWQDIRIYEQQSADWETRAFMEDVISDITYAPRSPMLPRYRSPDSEWSPSS